MNRRSPPCGALTWVLAGCQLVQAHTIPHPTVAVSESDITPEKLDALLDRFHQRLSDAGLKSTRQRDVIVRTFFELDKHISVEELLDAVRVSAPKTGYATVYRTLKLCVEHGFAQPRQFGDGQTRFDPQFGEGDEHDHLICVDCRRVVEFDNDDLIESLHGIVGELGEFSLKRRRIELYVKCQKEACEHRT